MSYAPCKAFPCVKCFQRTGHYEIGRAFATDKPADTARRLADAEQRGEVAGGLGHATVLGTALFESLLRSEEG